MTLPDSTQIRSFALFSSRFIKIFTSMNWILRFLLSSVAVVLTCYLLPGADVSDFWTAMVVAFVLSLVNIFIKPLLILLTIPVTIVSLGLFLLVINALMIMLTDYFVDGFDVRGFWWALLFSLILSLLNSLFIDLFSPKEQRQR
jgi:putative membrane protein